MGQHRILVPMDFTPVSDIALEHAFVVGKAFQSEILLLHIIANKKEMPEARERMSSLIERHSSAYPHKVQTWPLNKTPPWSSWERTA